MTENRNPIPVIINPSSGKAQPILHTISETFRAHNLTWRGHITYEFGDATRFAQQAAAGGADMVVVYGGDCTVLEVVNGVMGSNTAVGIIPGGTGNAVATELGISREINVHPIYEAEKPKKMKNKDYVRCTERAAPGR